VLSAGSSASLVSSFSKFRDFLQSRESLSLAGLEYTLSRRSEFAWKASFSGKSKQQLIEKLDRAAAAGASNMATRATPVTESLPPRILGVFTGQGAQWPAMGACLYSRSATFRNTIHCLEDALTTLPDPPSWSLSKELLATGSTSRIHKASISQPLCTALQIAVVDVFMTTGLSFSAVVGHSSGEIAAAYAAGFLDAQDAIRIAYYRGVHAYLAEGRQGQRGSMMAVGMSFEDATQFCKDFAGKIVVAASNARSSVTLSGDSDIIDVARRILDERKCFARTLKIDTAYHSHHMDPCAGPYLESLRRCHVQILDGPRRCNWYSSVYGPDGRSITDIDALRAEYWVRNMTQTVLFSQAVHRAVTEEHCHDIVLEVGPHPALQGPTLEMLKSLTGVDIPYSGVLRRGEDDVNALSDAVGFVWKSFSSTTTLVNLEGFRRSFYHQDEIEDARIIKNLPSYCWDHDKLLLKESRKSKAFRTRREPTHELLGTATSHSSGHLEQEVTWHQVMRLDELDWLRGHAFQKQVLFPAAGYVAMAYEASIRLAGDQPLHMVELTDLAIHRAITLTDNSAGTDVTFVIRVTDRRKDRICAEYSCFSGDVDAARGPEFHNFTGKAMLTLESRDHPPLPSRSEYKLPLTPVDVDHFYAHMSEYGLDYAGDFRVQSIRRRLNRSTITTNRINSDLRVHPMSLDAAFHSLFAAHSWPGDGRMWTTYLPTSIARIRIGSVCPDSPNSPDHALSGVLADCNITSADGKAISGNINIFCAKDGHPEMQIQQFTCSSFSQPRPEDDRQLYAKTVWARDISQGLDGQSTVETRSDDEKARLVEICERAAYFYCRQLRREIRSGESESMDWHMKHLVHWIFDHLLPTVQSGKHPHIRPEWENDTQETVDEWTLSYPDSIDLELIEAVGKTLPSILRGTVPALQVMMERNMLYRFYAEGLGFREGNLDLSAAVKQIAHRHPRMNILEVGAGTGGATSCILSALSNNFLSYTYTDISAGFFEAAAGIFQEYEDSMVFKQLDVAKEPTAQGFGEHSYDLVIASNVLHATESLAETMKNCRRLLKPGGYLAMLEITGDHLRPQFIVASLKGWFMGVDDGRVWAPTVSEGRWDAILREAGFSGVDFSVNSGFSVMTTQAVDERVMILRSPLASTYDSHRPPRIDNLVILGGRSPRTNKLCDGTKELLTSHASRVLCILGLDGLDDNADGLIIPMGAVVLCLLDLDEPVFKNMNEERFKALQKVFRNAKHLLWITQGCRDEVPEANMVIGLGRSLLQEFPDLQLQFLDVALHNSPEPTVLSEHLLRLVYLSTPRFQEVYWTAEHELALENGVVYIPRLVSNQTLNDRLNSTRRVISQHVRVEETPFELIQNGTGGFSAQSLNDGSRHGPSNQDDVACAVKFSSAFPFRLKNGRVVFFSVGAIDGDDHDALVLSEIRCSLLYVPKDDILGFMPGKDDTTGLQQFLVDVLTESVLKGTGADGLVWIHEPYEALIQSIRSVSARDGLSVFLTSSARDSDPRLRFIHPCITAEDFDQIVPAHVTAFLNMQPQTGSIVDTFPIESRTGDSAKTIGFFVAAKNQKSLNLCFDESQLRCLLDKSKSQHIGANISSDHVVSIQQIIAESRADWQPTSIIRWTTPGTVPLEIKPIDHNRLFSAQRTYLLVGLTGDLGLSICQWMVDNGARHLVIASRNPKVDPAVVQLLERKGARLVVATLDITNKEELERAYQNISATMPPIGGVANGAMVLQDKSFDNMTWDDFDKALRAKVQGSRNLDDLFHTTDLEFFVLFSSLASIFGNKGQSNYGAANMYMTSLAYQRRKRGVAASVIHIGMLLGVGYISRFGDQIQNRLARDGIMALSETDFHNLLSEAIVAGRPGSHHEIEIVTGIGKDTEAPWSQQPRFSAYVNKKVRTSEKRHQQSSGDVRSTIAAMTSEEEILSTLIGELSKALQIMLQISADKIDNQTALMDLGIDSLVAVQVRTWFLKELNVDIPVLRILSDASVQDLCKDASAKLNRDGGAAEGAAESGPSQSATAAVRIDWDQEIQSLFDSHKSPIQSDTPNGTNGTNKGICIVLTGATGFVGTHVLRRLAQDTKVAEIHCIAIRPDRQGKARHVSIQSPKIFEYSGHLTDEYCGLSAAQYHELARKADAVIHNAAEVNFLKSYGALKAVNVVSTARLAQLALARSIPIHLVSTAAVSFFASNNQLPEISPKDTPPSTDGSLGYAASKWASEVLLEHFAQRCGLPVFVHRAVIILGEGAPDTDLMTVVDRYSRKLQALPKLDDKLVDGILDMIDIEQLVKGLAQVVLEDGVSRESSQYRVLNYCNEEKVKVSELRQYYEKTTASRFAEMPMEMWLDEAAGLGLNPMVDFFLRESVKSGKPIPVPSLRKGFK
jgi:hybrid polyketide synthase/nonribosomal peptide synthetase ACE1